MKSWVKPAGETWVDVLRQRARQTPNEIALRFLASGEDETEVLTYAQLDARASAIAAALQPLAERGSRAVILLPNNVSFITTFFGCLYAGLVAVPGYPPRANRNKDRIAKVLRQCDGRLIISDGSVDRNEVMSGVSNMGLRNVRFVDASSFPAETPAGWTPVAVTPDELAFLQYTSGSTSDPKGVCLTHANLIENMLQVQTSFGVTSETRLVSWLPLYHDMGLIGGILLAVYIGFPFIFMPPASFVQKPMRWIKALSKYRATMAGGPNFTYDLCVIRYKADELKDLDLSSLETFFNGAEPIRPTSLAAFTKTYAAHGFNPSTIFACYGLAEASVFVTGGPKGGGARTVDVSKAALQKGAVESRGTDLITLVAAGSVGPRLEVAIVDPETTLRCPPDRVGEVWIHGANVSSGYWNNAEENARTFGRQIQGESSAKGYLRSGDLGFLRDDQLYVTGRIKDVIIVGGRNYYPHDLELTVQTRSAVAGIAAAFSTGEDEHVGLVVEVQRTAMKADFVAEALRIVEAVGREHEIMVRRIGFVRPGDLPRTSSGKVQRRLARKKLEDGAFELVHDWRAGDVAPVAVAHPPTPGDSTGRVPELRRWIREYFSKRVDLNLAHARKTFPPNVILDLGNHGLLGMLIPKSYGGLGLAQTEFTSVVEQLAAVDLSLAIFVGLNNILGTWPIVSHASDAVKAEVLPSLAAGRGLAGFALSETSAGSNPRAILARAETTERGVSLNGEKYWIGLATWASWLTVFAKEYDPKGASIGISAFLIHPDLTGVSFGPESMTMGVQPIVQAPVRLTDVPVEEKFRIGAPARGLAVAFEAMNLARFGLVSVSVGAMKRCYQLVEGYAAQRDIGSGRMIDNGLVRSRLQDIAFSERALSALSAHVAGRLDRGETVGDSLFMICKVAGPELLWETVDATMQLLGGRGYLESNGVAQMFRDARLLRIFEGPTEAMSYHLGALAATSGADEVYRQLGNPSNAILRDALRTFKETDAGAAATHVTYCGLGELVTWFALMTLVDDAPTRGFCQNRFESSLNELNARLARVSGEEPAAVSRRFEAEVGCAFTAEIGENWSRNLSNPSPRSHSVATPTAAAKIPRQPEPREIKVAALATDPAVGAAGAGHANLAFLRDQIKALRPAVAGRVTDDVSFAALGIDSIAAIELALAIEEKFGIQVPETLAWDYPTIAKAAEFISSKVKPA